MSLRLRLGLWYGGLTGITVLLVCFVVYTVHTRAHYDDLDRALVGAALHVAEESALLSPGQEAQALTAPVAPQVVIGIYDARGQSLATTPHATDAPAVDPRSLIAQRSQAPFGLFVQLAPRLIGVESDGGVLGVARDADGDRWRVYALPIARTGGYVVARAPLESIDASVAWLRRLVISLAILSAALAFLTGWLLARRALRPVAVLTNTARAIALARDFDRRVPTTADHDELGKLARTFNEMLASLERAYQAQQRFVSDASHELRAPLTVIQANLELIEDQPMMPPEEHREVIQQASDEARRLTALVADLLALARADAGIPVRHERVELDRVLLEALREARHLAHGQRLAIRELEPTIVSGDPDRLKQLLLILLDNAIKYTPPAGEIMAAIVRQNGTVELSVRDTGMGIPPDDLPHVFERFYRADPGRARDPGGTGLGLSIAEWIVHGHGGTIALDSAMGTGTTVTVHLPRLSD